MSEQLAIKIQGLKKQYRLGQIGGGTLTADLQSWWARVRHKEDPNSKIGTDQRLLGQRFWALNGIDLEIKKGEAIGIIGGNGAGKSTMLKILSRITAPTEGSVDIYGRIASMLEVGTGFSPEMTGRENIYMNGAILGMTKAEIDAKMEDIIEFSEVRDFIDTPVKRYSSGMYVKLAFSVAAHLDSEIMIMDEVLAVGDMAFQKKCLDKMRDAATVQGKTVLYVSHNMNTIRKLCDRCIVLDKGRIIFDGDVEEAIGIYMGLSGDTAACVDLQNRTRNVETNGGVRLQEMRVLEREEWVLRVGEKLRYAVTIKGEKDIDNIYYRNRIFGADGTSVSVLLLPEAFSCGAGEEKTIVIEADVSTLVPGKYCLSPSLYRFNEYGGWDFYDHVDAAVTFEVETIFGFNNNMPWVQHWWGHVKLPELTMLNDYDEK